MNLFNTKNRFHKIFYLGLIALVVSIFSGAASAQGKKSHGEPQKPVILKEADPASSSNTESKPVSAKSSNVFVQNLREALALREREIEEAKENLSTAKQLYNEGILARRAVEEAEAGLKTAEAKAEEIRSKIASYESPGATKTEETAVTKSEEGNQTVEAEQKKQTVQRTSQTRAKTIKKTQPKKTAKAKSN